MSKPCTPVVHIKIAGKWMFIPLKMVLIGIDPYPYGKTWICLRDRKNIFPIDSPSDGCPMGKVKKHRKQTQEKWNLTNKGTCLELREILAHGT